MGTVASGKAKKFLLAGVAVVVVAATLLHLVVMAPHREPVKRGSDEKMSPAHNKVLCESTPHYFVVIFQRLDQLSFCATRGHLRLSWRMRLRNKRP